MKAFLCLILLLAFAGLGCLSTASKSAPNMSQQSSELPAMKSPRIVVKKAARTIEVFDGSKLIKTYTMVLGSSPTGDKEVEGDGKTPEGKFYIFTKNPKSKFHLSLGISYPSKDDAKRGLEKSVITNEVHDQIVKAIDGRIAPPQKTALGGEIYLHGGGTMFDWTQGCIALANEDIEELFRSIPVGTEVEILP